MSLTTAVQTRYPSTLLVELTNFDAPKATTANAARLAAAVADAGAEFTTFTGLAFDDTNAQHLAVAVIGVLAILYEYTGTQKQNAETYRERFELGMRRVAGALGDETRILPASLSTRERSTEASGLLTDDDRSRFSDLAPRRVRGEPESDRDRRVFP